MDEFLISELFLNYKGEKEEKRRQGEDGRNQMFHARRRPGSSMLRGQTEVSGQALSV